jgi:hypothetical protein
VTPERTEATVLAELREVERYLTEAPPHSGHGAREALQARRDRLQRELRELRGGDRPG